MELSCLLWETFRPATQESLLHHSRPPLKIRQKLDRLQKVAENSYGIREDVSRYPFVPPIVCEKDYDNCQWRKAFSPTQKHDEEELKLASRDFDKAWTKTQEYYVKNSTRGIISTASAALNAILRSYKPRRLIVNEASQLTEYAAVAVMARFEDSLSKTLIENNPFSLDTGSEFGRTTKTSLMERLQYTGVPVTKLTIQYRMHPHISHTVSTLFYNSTLEDAPEWIDVSPLFFTSLTHRGRNTQALRSIWRTRFLFCFIPQSVGYPASSPYLSFQKLSSFVN